MADLCGIPAWPKSRTKSGDVILNTGDVIPKFESIQLGLLVSTFDIGVYRIDYECIVYVKERIEDGEEPKN